MNRWNRERIWVSTFGGSVSVLVILLLVPDNQEVQNEFRQNKENALHHSQESWKSRSCQEWQHTQDKFAKSLIWIETLQGRWSAILLTMSWNKVASNGFGLSGQWVNEKYSLSENPNPAGYTIESGVYSYFEETKKLSYLWKLTPSEIYSKTLFFCHFSLLSF